MEIVRLFTGWDSRESVGWHVFAQSVVERSSSPVALIPIGSQFTERDGTNAFTYSRFLVPWVCEFRGFAIFADGADMLALADVGRLWDLRKEMQGCAVMVVKHDYRTRHARKYVGTDMESANSDYPRKNWSSLVLWDCGHYMNRRLTPEWVQEQGGADLQRLAWLPDDRIGALPPEWNFLVGEGAQGAAAVAHFTLGIPGFREYRDCEHSGEWRAALDRAMAGLQTHYIKENHE